jgi:hypothetical protein
MRFEGEENPQKKMTAERAGARIGKRFGPCLSSSRLTPILSRPLLPYGTTPNYYFEKVARHHTKSSSEMQENNCRKRSS